MVKIMLTPDHGRQPTTGKGRGDGLQVDGAAGGVEVFNALRGKGLPTEASTCIFWCAVALGALVRGSPIETVSRVSRTNSITRVGGTLQLLWHASCVACT